jgi:hypothetical protein
MTFIIHLPEQHALAAAAVFIWVSLLTCSFNCHGRTALAGQLPVRQMRGLMWLSDTQTTATRHCSMLLAFHPITF